MNLIAASAVPMLLGSRHAGMIDIRPDGLNVDPAGPLDMRVDAVEELGAQRLVHGHISGDPLTLMQGAHEPRADRLPLSVAPEAIHLFDGVSGARID